MRYISQLFMKSMLAWSCLVVGFTTGCASGGFHLTREYARFINSKTLILRIILYIFTSVVFVVTLLIDMVIFNTIDFWEGRVSQGDYEFKKDGKTYHARHEILPGTGLKRSTIKITDSHQALIQEVILSETARGEIDLYVDGQLRTRIKDIHSAPVAFLYDAEGRSLGSHVLTDSVALK